MIASTMRLFDQSLFVRLTETLLHCLWQCLAIGFATTIASWLFSNSTARVRYGIHAVGLMLMAVCIPVTFGLVDSQHRTGVESVIANATDTRPSAIAGLATNSVTGSEAMETVENRGLKQGIEHHQQPSEDMAMIVDDAQRQTADSNATVENDAVFARWNVGEAIERFAPYAVCAYFVGLLAMMARLASALWGGHRLRRCATAVADPKLLGQIRAQASRVGLRFVPVVAYCERITIPVVAGIIRPMILLPLWLLTEMDPEQVLVILAHEMAHIRRFDLIMNLLQRLLETVLFFHPAVWWVSRQLSVERENCCDDAVIEAGYAPLQYASTLVSLAERCAVNRRPLSKSMLALAATGANSGQLKRRIFRLLGVPQRFVLTRGDSLMLLLMVALMMSTITALMQLVNAAAPDTVTQPQDVLPQEAIAEKKPVAKADDGAVPAEPAKMVAYHGQVVDKEGKAIAGAEVWYVLPTEISTPLGEIIGSGSIRKVCATDSEGHFSFSVEPPNWKGSAYSANYVVLTAKAPGYGCDWMPLAAFETDLGDSERRDRLRSQLDKGLGEGRFDSRTFKLPPEADPIQGRLVDLEGRPLAEVEICVQSVHNVDVDRLKKAFETSSPETAEQARRTGGAPGWLSSADWQVLFPRPKTNENGEFTMRGLARDQVATITLYHERVDAEQLHIVGTEIEPQRLAPTRIRAAGPKVFYFGTRFTHAAGPAISVSGVVTELQTGKPVVNAAISVERLFGRGDGNSAQLRFARHIKAMTDEQGRYTLVGIPPGSGHVIQVFPQITEPLLTLEQEFSVASTEATATLNLQLCRGIWIEGKVTDAETGTPVSGHVDYFPFQDNPNSTNPRGYFASITHRFFLDTSGHYRVVGLPGPGVVMVRSFSGKVYPKAAGAEKIEGFNAKTNRLPTVIMRRPLQNWNQVTFVNPPADVTSYELDMTLSTGLTVSGRIIGPDDSLLTDIEAMGLVFKEPVFRNLKDATFTVANYTSEQPRDLFFRTVNRSLVGYLHLEGKPPEELTVQLQPAVSVRGRLVETDTDEPAIKYHLLCESSKQGEFRTDREKTDDKGRFEIKGLLSGNVYKMEAANSEGFINRKNGFTIDLTDAKPGDVIDLGDVTGKNAKQKK